MMRDRAWRRRDVLKTLAGAAAAGALAVTERESRAQEAAAKWSSGTERPKLKAPPNAADCHLHIYDAKYPAAANAVLHPPDALVDDYRVLQRRLGTARQVIIQPSTYGTDNRCALAALAAFGKSARMIAVVNDTVTDAELKRLDGLGVRGIRFNLAQAGATTPEMIDPLAKRIAPLGWHVQINAPADKILEVMPILERIPAPVVFDHMAHLPEPNATSHPVFARVTSLLEKGRGWVKLSGAYGESKVGPPTYADSTVVARAYVAAAPERCVWGSDWPHPTEQNLKPDDAVLFDLLMEWAPDPATRHRILVENPEQLYRF
jgi:D-galactarolactone isomerase